MARAYYLHITEYGMTRSEILYLLLRNLYTLCHLVIITNLSESVDMSFISIG